MKEFELTFQLSKKRIFEVCFHGHGGEPYFSTSAAEFNQPKTDYNRCGQCQDEILRGYPRAMRFYKKWDVLHLHRLSKEQYVALMVDIGLLKQHYNWINTTSFYSVREFSKQTPKSI